MVARSSSLPSSERTDLCALTMARHSRWHCLASARHGFNADLLVTYGRFTLRYRQPCRVHDFMWCPGRRRGSRQVATGVRVPSS